MGGRVRNLAILQALSPHFDLDVVTLVHRPEQLRDPGPVAAFGRWEGVLAPNRRSPGHRLWGQIDYRMRGAGREKESWFLGPGALARAVLRRLEERPPDIVHTAYWYTLQRLGPRPRPPRWVLDTHDVQFERWSKLRGEVSTRERDAEIAELRRHDVVVAITPRDADTFRSVLGPAASIETIPMGVDLAHWDRGNLGNPARRDSVLYYGNLASEGNVEAARHLVQDILPLVRARRPRTEVVLVGADPSPAVRTLAGTPGVRITGTLLDPRMELATGGVFALCLRAASGIRSRACEAMALGVPVVAYPESLEGMGFVAGRHYLAARSPDEFAAAVDEVLERTGSAEALVAAAREEVGKRYSIAATYGRFVTLYQELLRGKEAKR
jgi:glycosyltransferase involved in cell wall biosynthesis